jgi:hypothetical protein
MSAGHEMGGALLVSFYGSKDIKSWLKESWVSATLEIKKRVIGFGFTFDKDGKLLISLSAGIGKLTGGSYSVPNASKYKISELDPNSGLLKKS